MTTLSKAAKKFWLTPELVVGLLPFLDTKSTLNLAKLHPLVVQIFQRALAWKKLVQRSLVTPFPVYPSYLGIPHSQGSNEEFSERVRILKEILKMMEDPKPLLMDFLVAICQRFPEPCSFARVKIFCPLAKSYFVSVEGFLLIEELEQAFGTTELLVQEISFDFVLRPPINHPQSIKEPLLSAISSRASRQMIEMLWLGNYCCATKEHAETFSTLLKNSKRVRVDQLVVEKGVGPEGWAALAKAVSLHPLEFTLNTRADAMLVCRKKDLRSIWDNNMHGEWVVLALRPPPLPGLYVALSFNDNCEENWKRLQQFLDATEGISE